MTFEIEVYDALCVLKLFEINGMDADENDFVDKYDHSPDVAEDYGCGDMIADIIPATEVILEKYSITLQEYTKIAEKVSEKVSFGPCGWCI